MPTSALTTALRRLTCRLLGHEPMKVPREEEGGGYALRCRRCGEEGVRRR